MVLLVSVVSFIANNITAFLIIASLIAGYTLIESTDAIFTQSLFNSNSSSLSLRLDYCMMETRE